MQTWNLKKAALGVAAVAIVVLVVPAVAAPLAPPAPDPYPRMAFVARNDNPFDALSVGAVAGAVGGVIAITRSDELSVAAATVLQEFQPDVVIIAGGPGAISEGVESAIGDLADWDVRRAAGANRDETAREIGRLIQEYGLGRPAMLSTSSGQNVGDLYLGGHFEAESATVGGVDLPAQGPITWATAERDLPHTGPDAEIASLEIDVPANGGVIVATATGIVVNSSTTDPLTVSAWVTLDATDPDDEEAFWAATIALSGLDLAPDPADGVSGGGFTAHGAAPVDAGTHTVYALARWVGDAFMQQPSLTVTWYPQGTAAAPGYDPS